MELTDAEKADLKDAMAPWAKAMPYNWIDRTRLSDGIYTVLFRAVNKILAERERVAALPVKGGQHCKHRGGPVSDQEHQRRARDFFDSVPEPEGTIEEIIEEANRTKWADLFGIAPDFPDPERDLRKIEYRIKSKGLEHHGTSRWRWLKRRAIEREIHNLLLDYFLRATG